MIKKDINKFVYKKNLKYKFIYLNKIFNCIKLHQKNLKILFYDLEIIIINFINIIFYALTLKKCKKHETRKIRKTTKRENCVNL